jgi:hypothetical protein
MHVQPRVLDAPVAARRLAECRSLFAVLILFGHDPSSSMLSSTHHLVGEHLADCCGLQACVEWLGDAFCPECGVALIAAKGDAPVLLQI